MVFFKNEAPFNPFFGKKPESNRLSGLLCTFPVTSL